MSAVGIRDSIVVDFTPGAAGTNYVRTIGDVIAAFDAQGRVLAWTRVITDAEGIASQFNASPSGSTITHGDQMNASNTGYTAYFDTGLGRLLMSSDLTPSSGGTNSGSGQLIYAQNFTNELFLTGNNNIVRGCKAQSNGGSEFSHAFRDGGNNNRFEYCTVLPNPGFGFGFGILSEGSGSVYEFLDITRCGNLISYYGTAWTCRYSYLHAAGNPTTPADHVDGIELYSGDNVLLRYNRIDCSGTVPGAQSTVSPLNNAPWGGNTCNVVEIFDNFIDGGNAHYLADGQTTGINDIRNARLLRNRFGGHTNSTFGTYASFQNSDGRATVQTLAAQAANTTAVLWPTGASDPDVNRWATGGPNPALDGTIAGP